jgi:hypothetical protein
MEVVNSVSSWAPFCAIRSIGRCDHEGSNGVALRCDRVSSGASQRMRSRINTTSADLYALSNKYTNYTPLTPTPTLVPSPTATSMFLPIESFVGIWQDVDPNTEDWTKIEITRYEDTLSAHSWGACLLTDCDAGVTSASQVAIQYSFGNHRRHVPRRSRRHGLAG